MFKPAPPPPPAQETNYKQVSKLKHLSSEHTHLKSLVHILEQLNHRSRLLLKSVQDKTKNLHLNFTACSFGSITNNEPTSTTATTKLIDEDLHDIESLVASLASEISSKKKQFQAQSQRQEKSKVEDQMLFRKMLYEYEGRLTAIKGDIRLREENIQEIERLHKEGGGQVQGMEQKILGVYYTSFELFDDLCFYQEQMKETVVNTRKVEQEIQKVRGEIRKLEQFGQKLKVAKAVKMPYFKFRNIMKHGLVSMENEDREEYAAFLELQKAAADEEDLARPTRSKVQQETQTPVTPEMLYLIIRKEEINKELLNKLIREEDRKQEELLAQNQLLKQALLTRQQQQYFLQVQSTIKQHFENSPRQHPHRHSLPSSPRNTPPPNTPSQSSLKKKKLNPTDYHMYLDRLGKKVEDLMTGCIMIGSEKRGIGRSKSQRVIVGKGEEAMDVEGGGDGTARFIEEEGIFEEYNGIITERFYGEELEYQFVQ